ncbi:MAG: group II intron reverse transcriptase [Xenococcus sp. (in: cyanobacteria)]
MSQKPTPCCNDADISKCFDKINHSKLLEKLNTFPTLRKQIRAWLKAGVMDGQKLFPHQNEGTPQGGVISPLLANIALHGLENEIKNLANSFDMKRIDGTQLSKRDKRKSVNIIRYADDFLIFHEDINTLNKCVEVTREWLKDIGLELKPSKTRIAHTLNCHKKERPGFNFLGFNIKQHKTGKYTCGKNRKGLLGFKTLITPSKEAQKRHYRKLVEIIDKNKGQSQITLISKLNPVIRGWCNYYSTVVSQKVFERLTHIFIWKLLKWGIKRHRNKGIKWVKTRYFRSIGDRNWVFAAKVGENHSKLIIHPDTKIKRHVKVKGNASPYDGNLIYWSTRLGRNPEMPMRTASLLKKQKGKCNQCGLTFREEDVMETDHIIPTAAGGKDIYQNLQLLHRHCHDAKTTADLKVIKEHKNKVRMKQFHKWFNKMDWIWIDDIPVMVKTTY